MEHTTNPDNDLSLQTIIEDFLHEITLHKAISAAKIRLMLDAMLSPSEASNVRCLYLWGEEDGNGHLTVNDRVVRISPGTIDLLNAMSKRDPRARAVPDDTGLPAG